MLTHHRYGLVACTSRNPILLWVRQFPFLDQSRTHDDVIKWKHFPRNWPFVGGIHRSRVNSPHKGQWRGALVFSLICVWINDWVINREAGDFRRYRAHYDVIVMSHRGHWVNLYLDWIYWQRGMSVFGGRNKRGIDKKIFACGSKLCCKLGGHTVS